MVCTLQRRLDKWSWSFSMEASFELGNSGISWNKKALSQTFDLENFVTARQVFVQQRRRLSMINWWPFSIEVRWQYLRWSTFDRRSMPVNRTECLPLCTALRAEAARRAGPSAAAKTCLFVFMLFYCISVYFGYIERQRCVWCGSMHTPPIISTAKGIVFSTCPFVCAYVSAYRCAYGRAGEAFSDRLSVDFQFFSYDYITNNLVCHENTFHYYRAMLCIRGTSHGPLSVRVCHKSVFYRNGWTNRAGFWRVSFLPPVLHCVKRKFGYLQK